MTFDRARAGAWVDSLGSHPHAPIIRSILADRDEAAAKADELESQMKAVLDRCRMAEMRAQTAATDAARLAAWIIANPSGHDPSEVLNLHDRSTQ